MIETSPTFVKLPAALHLAQGELKAVLRDAQNLHFKSRYATLENVIDAAKPALQAHFLAFVQAPGSIVDGSLEMTTMLIHASGEWIRSTMHIPLSKKDPQGVGSACTYGARYSLMAMLGIPPTDDDGEAAMDRETAAKPKRVVGINPKTGMQTAFALKKTAVWENEFEPELLECETVSALTKFALAWSVKAESDKWPEDWRKCAKDEINKRREVIINGLPDDDEFPGDTAGNSYVDNFIP